MKKRYVYKLTKEAEEKGTPWDEIDYNQDIEYYCTISGETDGELDDKYYDLPYDHDLLCAFAEPID